jgi:hypothetical protein
VAPDPVRHPPVDAQVVEQLRQSAGFPEQHAREFRAARLLEARADTGNTEGSSAAWCGGLESLPTLSQSAGWWSSPDFLAKYCG